MMNRMMKAEAVLAARAMAVACIILRAANDNPGGSAKQSYKCSKLL